MKLFKRKQISRVLVTGGTGFVGRCLTRILSQLGYEVAVLTRNLDNLQDNSMGIRGNLVDFQRWKVTDFSPDACIAAAWISTPGEYEHSDENEKFERQYRTFFRLMGELGIKRVIGIGSCFEYGSEGGARLTEADLGNATQTTPYARAKRNTADQLEEVAVQYGFSYSWAIPFFVYGDGEPRQKFCSWVARQMLKDKDGFRIDLRNPDSRLDYINVKDVAAGIAHLVAADDQGAVNLASGEVTSPRKICEMLAATIGANSDGIREGKDSKRIDYASTSGALLKSGFRPSVSLERGLEDLVASLKEDTINGDA